MLIGGMRALRHQTSSLHILAIGKHSRQPLGCCEVYDPGSVSIGNSVRQHDEPLRAVLDAGESMLDLVGPGYRLELGNCLQGLGTAIDHLP